MIKSHRISYMLVSLLTLLGLTLAACASPAAGLPATVAAVATTLPATAAALATTLPATVAALATTLPATVAAAATTIATTLAPASSANTLTYDDNIDDIVSLDPAQAYEFSGILAIHNVYQNLVQYVGSDLATLKPGLADSWAVKDAGDHWELTFNLHPGNKFASGNPITADDVVYSFSRVVSLNKSPAFLFTSDSGLTAASFKAVDPQTVVISMPKTNSPQVLLSILTFTVAGIVDSTVVKTHDTGGDFGNAWLMDHSAGSGPYAVDHWTKDVEVLLTSNPNYAGTRPALASILIKHVADSSVQQAELQKGDADIAQNMTPEQLATLTGAATTTKGDSLLLFYIGMNVTVKPLDNVKVREALRMAIDYDGIIKDLLSGNAKKVQTIVPAGLLGYNNDAPFQADVAGAKALLQAAGVSNVTLDMLVPTGAGPGGVTFSDLAAKLQSDWAAIGVTVNLKQVATADLLTSYRAQKGQLVMIYWGPDFPDPDGNVTPFTSIAAKSIAYRNAWDDPIATKATAATLITDPTARAAAYKDITEYVLHNGPYIILYQPTQLFGIRSNVQGFAWNPMGYADFWSISKTS
jgi:peptide/nickel transport system substrate-binding protein